MPISPGCLAGTPIASGTCRICGRELSNPASIAAGIGPVCAARYRWLRAAIVAPLDLLPSRPWWWAELAPQAESGDE